MIILGIDPGTTRIGFGIIKKDRGTLSCVRYGLIAKPPSDKFLAARHVVAELTKLITEYQPTAAAVEKLFFFKNQKTVISVSEMRGMLISVLAASSIPIYEYTPLQVKQAVSGYGRAGKDQVQRMVKLILGLKEEIKPDDAADGLAIAICCANTIIEDK